MRNVFPTNPPNGINVRTRDLMPSRFYLVKGKDNSEFPGEHNIVVKVGSSNTGPIVFIENSSISYTANYDWVDTYFDFIRPLEAGEEIKIVI